MVNTDFISSSSWVSNGGERRGDDGEWCLFTYPHSAKIVKNPMRNTGGEIDQGKDARYDSVINFMCVWSF